ncbi:MAG: hypothetical protein DA328_06815 [Nitrososphaeraceae archaeon]|nr:hypothetical protein [Nitrososphaeraceae archaeon]
MTKSPILIRTLSDTEYDCNNDLIITKEIKHISIQFIYKDFIFSYFDNPNRMEKNMFFIFVDHQIAEKLSKSMFALSYNFTIDSSKTIFKNFWNSDQYLTDIEKSELLRTVMQTNKIKIKGLNLI